MLRGIQRIAAEHLGKAPADVSADSTFADIGADELDLVEITMKVEDKFGIVIQDRSLLRAAGVADGDQLLDHLTIRNFATVAESAPQQVAEPPRAAIPDDGNLHESQVGSYRELSALENPEGLVLVFVPDFEAMKRITEQRVGRTLGDAEVAALRADAVVIAMRSEVAAEFVRERSNREIRKQK